MKFKDLLDKIKKWCKEDSEEKEEDENYDKFIKRTEKRMDKIFAAQKADTHEGRARIALMFENAYTQKQISKANKTLGRATTILAIATIALVISSAYGAIGLEKAINETAKALIVILFIGLILWALGILGKAFKLIIKLFKKKK